jgi:hypothetical protein
MIGINENDIIERPMSFWRQQVSDERQDPNTAEELVKMRYENYDTRRKHKVKVIYDFITNNQAVVEKDISSSGRQLHNTFSHKSNDKFNGLIREKMDRDL